MNDQSNESFRAQVERLVAEGKLTPEEGQELLGDPEGMDAGAAPQGVAAQGTDSGEDTPPDLRLEVTAFTLQAVGRRAGVEHANRPTIARRDEVERIEAVGGPVRIVG